MTAIDSARSLA